MSECYSFVVNGVPCSTEEEKPLLRYLRDELRLTSVKDGCSEGACGTCTILVDGKAVKACVLSTKRAAGKEIVTVEGLSEAEREAFVYAFGAVGAVQCGFCIPGMVMAGKALLDQNPNPSEAEIKKAIRGNVCRCTGYKKIIEGIALAGAILRGEASVDPALEEGEDYGVGARAFRTDVRDKVLGRGEYCDDLYLDGMAHASAVRSQYPRARVLDIDASAALALPGVLAVLTADDVPHNKVGHLQQDWDVMIAKGDITRCVGDAVCLVVAENEAVLKQAKELVKVDYEPLEPVRTIQEARAADAPSLHPNGNLCQQRHVTRGDARAALAQSKYVVTQSYRTPFTEHAFLEPECAVAFPYKDGVKVYTSDQGVYDTRKEISIMLGWEPECIVVENKLVGGGFGGKEDVTVQHQAALIAYITKRAVKVKLTRKESILVHPKRHPMSIDLTTACDENGRLTAMKAVVVADTGAYASLGGPVLQRACTHAAGTYNYQVIDIDGKAVYTNNPPAGAFRGFGVTQTCFATEMNINLLAEMCGMDPWQFRYLNAIRPGQVLPNGQIADPSTGLAETLEAVKDIYYSHPYVGIGCAMKNAGVGVGLPDTGRVRLIVEGGKVHIHSGASCIGQGVGTVLVQMLAESAGISMDEIEYHRPNTSMAPDSGTTSGSRQTLVTGEACRRAAKDLRRALFEATGRSYEATEMPSAYLSNVMVAKESPETAAVTFTAEEVALLNGKEFYGEYLAKTDKMGADVEYPVSHVAYGYATQLCILKEDGTIEKMVGAHDVGKVVNPKSAEGQVEGGIVMGCGYALTEQYPLKDCVPTAKYGTLGLFRADKAPEVESIIVEKPGVDVAFGAIGIGEITSIPTAPAVAGAYYKWNQIFETELPLKNTPYAKKK